MRRLSVIIGTIGMLLALGLFAESANASPMNDLKDKQKGIKNERKEIKSKLSKAEKEIADLMIDLEELNAEIEQLNDAIKHNENMLKETENDIKSSEKEISNLEEEITEIEDNIKYRNNLLKNRLSSLQKGGGVTQYVEVLFGAESFMDFVSRITTVTQIANNDIDLIEEQEADKQLVVDKRDEVNNKLAEQKDMRQELKGTQTLIADQQKENKKRKKNLKDKEKEINTLIADLEDKDSSLASIEAQVKREIASAREAERNMVANASDGGNLKQLSNNSGGKVTGNLAGYKYRGIPYRTAGKSPSQGGFDCSGYVAWEFAQKGISVPSSTAGLVNVGQRIDRSQLQPGDLVFFNTYKTNGHVGIYIGNGKFFGAQNSTGLDEANMNDSYWGPRFNHARRIN